MKYPVSTEAMVTAAKMAFAEGGHGFSETDEQYYAALANVLNDAYEQGIEDGRDGCCRETAE